MTLRRVLILSALSLLLLCTASVAVAQEEESAEPRITLLEYQDSKKASRKAHVTVAPSQILSVLRKQKITTATALAKASPTSLGAALAKGVKGLGSIHKGVSNISAEKASTSLKGKDLSATPVSGSTRSALGRALAVKLIANAKKSKTSDLARAIKLPQISVFLNPSRTY